MGQGDESERQRKKQPRSMDAGQTRSFGCLPPGLGEGEAGGWT